MMYQKPELFIEYFDIEDIIQSSSISPTDPPEDPPVDPPVTDPSVQIPGGGNVGTFEDFDDPNPTQFTVF